jgi:hypothetical protein
MRKSIVFCAVCFGILSGAYLSTLTKAARLGNTAAVPKPALTKQEFTAPEFLPYAVFLQHMNDIKSNPGLVRIYAAKTGLAVGRFKQLLHIAEDYSRDVSAIDGQAKIIIDRFHAQYPPGKLPSGIVPPTPPQELTDLQNQRDNTALKYRERLQAELGIDFNKASDYVQREIKSKIAPEPNAWPRLTEEDVKHVK